MTKERDDMPNERDATTNERDGRSFTMRSAKIAMAGFVLIGSLALTIMTRVPDTAGQTAVEEPSHLEKIEGTDLGRVTLSERAAQRLGIATAQVADEEIDGKAQMTIPYSAVFYDASGATWTYVTTEPLVYVRDPISVDRIDGDVAYLSAGPDVGTDVVTVGSAELFGVERYGH